MAHIGEIFGDSQGRYGSPRVHLELQAAGIHCSQKRVAHLMKEHHLVALKPRRFVVTPESNHAFPVARNILNREYQVEAVAGLNRAWAGDITYIPTAQGGLYVAVVLDLKSRRVIGWSMRDSLEQTLVHEALEMALGQRPVTEAQGELLFHSDRGSQYAGSQYAGSQYAGSQYAGSQYAGSQYAGSQYAGSQYAAQAYQERLLDWGMVCSMSRRGNCWDNAVVESFFATLKKEEGIESIISPMNRPKPACFTTSKSFTIGEDDIPHWAT